MKRFWIAVVMLGAVSLWLVGCNTIAGIGKDVKRAGAAVEKAAEKAKN